MPSCIDCNRKLGAIEQEFFVRVALSMDPNDPASRSSVAKALDSLNPNKAKGAADQRARQALATAVLGGILHGDQIPDEGAYPGLGERWGRSKDVAMAIPIPARLFERITEKIVRGITYLEGGQFIELPHRYEFYALSDSGAKELRELMSLHGQVFAVEPGIVVKRLVTPEDGLSAIFEIELWKQFKTYASVMPDEGDEAGA